MAHGAHMGWHVRGWECFLEEQAHELASRSIEDWRARGSGVEDGIKEGGAGAWS